MERHFKPQTDGKAVPSTIQQRTRARIAAHAAKTCDGRYSRLEVRFRGARCYLDAYQDGSTTSATASVGAGDVDRLGHRVVDGDLVGIGVRQGLDQVEVALADDADELAGVHHREVADRVAAHELVGGGQRGAALDGPRLARHVTADRWHQHV